MTTSHPLRRCIISSVGTSSLTHGVEGELKKLLTATANLRADDLTDEQRLALDGRIVAVQADLVGADVARRRQLSAELNGIYGLCNGSLGACKDDLHFLVATDTYQGGATARLVEAVLRGEDVPAVEIVTPTDLSTRSQAEFDRGMRDLIRWCEQTLPGYGEAGYRVVFNLVGSFKSLQGYLNTIGMFYADEIVYIFEGPGSPLLRIPRLPVMLDPSVFERHRELCARMAEGNQTVPVASLADWHEALWEEYSPGQAGLSTWGLLLWERYRDELLFAPLLTLPRLRYSDRFRRDFDGHNNRGERVRLQEALVEASCILEKSQGNTKPLASTGLKYSNYTGRHSDVGHFRISDGLRVSCRASGGELLLLRFGNHDEVNDNPE